MTPSKKKNNAEFTNAEKRAKVYRNEGTPTIPSKVTSRTPLAALNLNWRERELRERDRTKHVHRLHPYLGKFIPQLVEIFLRKYFRPGDIVLDPFCGSGTTLVQANELGINSIGYDISEFNILLCKAKLARYEIDRLRKEAATVLGYVQGASAHTDQIGIWESGEVKDDLPPSDNTYLKTWYAPQALRQMLLYRKAIEEGSYRYKNLLKVILSRSARSARLTTHFDLDFPKKPQTEPYFCYKHSRQCTPTTDALKFLDRYTIDTIDRIQEFNKIRTDADAKAIHGDSKTAKLPEISGVITSPPYLGLIDYHEQHAYAYHLFGLPDNRKHEIGAAAKGSSQKAKAAYIDEIASVFMSALSAMKRKGILIVVANDKYEIYPSIAEKLGVTTVGIIERHVNRRTGRRSGDFFERIFIWQKK